MQRECEGCKQKGECYEITEEHRELDLKAGWYCPDCIEQVSPYCYAGVHDLFCMNRKSVRTWVKDRLEFTRLCRECIDDLGW